MATMIVVEASSKSSNNTMTNVDMANIIDQEVGASSWKDVSERTMSLEEDERMRMSACGNDDDNLISHHRSIGFAMETRMGEEDDDIISSCSSIHSNVVVDDEIHHFGSTRRRRRRRATRVRFAPKVAEYLIMSLDEYTQDEIEKSWWTPDEKEVMDRDQSRIVTRLEAGLKEKRSQPYRGLEGRASGCSQHVMETRKAYVATVVSEMERQWNETDENEFLLDWEKIASLAKEITKQSTQEALLIALYDEKEARGVAHHRQAINSRQSWMEPPSNRISKNRGPVSPKNTKNKKSKGLKPYCSRLLSVMKKH